MTDEEVRKYVEEFKAQVKAHPDNKDKDDEEIEHIMLEEWYKAYKKGKMDKESLLGLAEELGYEPTEEFENGDEEGPEIPEDEDEDAPEAGKEALEEARTIKPGEDVEEFKEKIEDIKEGEEDEAKDEAPAPVEEEEEEVEDVEEEDDGEEMSEDEQRKKAMELFRL